ncbi:putative glycosyltransferase At5g20260 [Silene latifolia]|uniref:putative glycosyltransferase At5g20260 n=1 Tax=Silene latifolia TaxID=37657 RepID=UPI003D78887F
MNLGVYNVYPNNPISNIPKTLHFANSSYFLPTHSTMTTTSFSLLFLLFAITAAAAAVATDPNPYFSKNTLFKDHKKMASNLKIFIYPLPQNTSLTLTHTLPPPLSLFYTTLLTSPYVTRHPSQATLFFLPFPPISTRSLARHIDYIRTSFPYWDRSLGADHFYLTGDAVVPASTRNVVELRKNAIQISSFPSPAREFVPHKDLTLPPQFTPLRAQVTENLIDNSHVSSTRYLGYFISDRTPMNSLLIDSLRHDVKFLMESEVLDEMVVLENMSNSKFCILTYEVNGMLRLSAAMAQGCVPVVITDRPIQDLPLMDVIRWSEIALFVGSEVGPEELKLVLKRACEEEIGGYEKKRGMGIAASRHMMWNSEEMSVPEPYDAFEMVMYQLWLRRHAIRYSRWDGGLESA